ncbi:PREDICTED: calcium uniporter protein 2, mitochondrial-like [Nicotiana attenuata]|uniref:Calcium uniporter protein 2, mitochondrial n=1 Tax=Nicotiana attenuata TaxID=49451 RepID=A0A1J6HZM6_NICAT|nr:PREDICTED: calcium uniporter protein 2, mitochondrial-like [Nicotiana attenuata]OIS98284.1 calcium uniporter protein 2, mitochondrial [Nicotiana attenuata]
MAFKKTLPERIFSAYKFTAPSSTTCRIASSSMLAKCQLYPNPDKNITHDAGDGGLFRRFLHQSLASPPELRSLPTGEKLREKLRGMDISRDRIRLNGLVPPTQRWPELEQLGVTDARKLLRLSQLEMVKVRLRKISKNWILCSEFHQICNETCSNVDQGLEFAKMLDGSGDVIVLGNVVFLRPDQVVKAMQELMPMPKANPNHEIGTNKELQQMEEQKAAIDKKAESLVRREMWCGLSCFILQTAAFMRFTFWDLTWDVMEPICFYVTSIYCMAGFAFFLKTSKEPSFEGFFKARFSTKQKQLMKLHKFDHQRYNELRRAYYPHSASI